MELEQALEVLRKYDASQKENVEPNEPTAPPPSPMATAAVGGRYLKPPKPMEPPPKRKASPWQEFVFDEANRKKYKYKGIPRKDSPQYAKLKKAYEKKQKARK